MHLALARAPGSFHGAISLLLQYPFWAEEAVNEGVYSGARQGRKTFEKCWSYLCNPGVSDAGGEGVEKPYNLEEDIVARTFSRHGFRLPVDVGESFDKVADSF